MRKTVQTCVLMKISGKMHQLLPQEINAKSQHFFIGGLFGNAVVEAGEICGSEGVRQLQTQEKVEDRLLTIITMGIYAPRTAKVWCNNK